MLGTGDHYSILIASKLDGLLSESGANLEHPFRGREMGSGPAPGLRRRSAQFTAVEVASGSVCLLKITITRTGSSRAEHVVKGSAGPFCRKHW